MSTTACSFFYYIVHRKAPLQGWGQCSRSRPRARLLQYERGSQRNKHQHRRPHLLATKCERVPDWPDRSVVHNRSSCGWTCAQLEGP